MLPHRVVKRAHVVAIAAVALACGSEDTDDTGQASTGDDLCSLLPDACEDPEGAPPALTEAVTVVPNDNMPDGVVSQDAHNNLDIVWFQDRLYFAFRTGQNHFAHFGVRLYIVSTTDQRSWRLEADIHLEKDLREPRFLPVGDRLFMYFARLGEIPYTFKPEAVMVTERLGDGDWSDAVEIKPTGEDGFIPWRGREAEPGVGHLIGYVGGDSIYDQVDGTRVHWLKTTDGMTFEPVVGDDSVVLSGGVSETDWTILEDGTLVAATRNEGGDEDGYGSKICRADAGDLGSWTCAHDPKKYDSPLVFRHRDTAYLVGRRQVANDGLFDLGMEGDPEDFYIEYQNTYWGTPKRCALWELDEDDLTATWVLDLPSNGDTCFASVIPLSETKYLLYNYSSPLDDPDLAWREGQHGETFIYRTTLTLP